MTVVGSSMLRKVNDPVRKCLAEKRASVSAKSDNTDLPAVDEPRRLKV